MRRPLPPDIFETAEIDAHRYAVPKAGEVPSHNESFDR
ncbi:hypothetical protein HNQ87_002892 [Pacificimonas flava]|uniref:Uncharacterized protein n=1 Tax=Pacificimonas flava TaxID=1234595 RepID=M2U0W1_9SPHN|nr:hypothetical protein C725_2998 [Pacificimonas flava]MBB5281706.1 hypothetical protein [Pacificimonas flava]